MKLIGYLRVSTDEQAQSGLGLAAQEAKIRAYAELYGHELVEVITDAGQSAKSLKRPGITQALAMLGSGEADGLLVAKLDRLTRSVADMASLTDKYFSEKAGKALLSVQDQIDTTTAGGRLVLNVLMSVAQWEREAISERTVAALSVKRGRGECLGLPALGKRWADGEHVEDESELEAVKLIFDLRDSGLTMRQIVAELNERGTPCPRKAKTWHLTQVHRILKRVG